MPSALTAQRLATLAPEVCQTVTQCVCVCVIKQCVCVTFCRPLIVGLLVFDISD